MKRNFIEFDFYLPQYDLYIEYQGGDHHRARDKKHETLVRRINIDFKKRKYAYENKMNFIALEEYHLKDLSKVFEVLLNFKKN